MQSSNPTSPLLYNKDNKFQAASIYKLDSVGEWWGPVVEQQKAQ